MLGVSTALAPLPAEARLVAGKEIPDQIEVAGRELVLNGAAVQKVFVFKVYAVGLYLENPTRDPGQALKADEAKRIHLRVLRSASRKQIADALRNGMQKSGADMAALEERIQQLARNIPDVRAGQELLITYVPGVGTELSGQGRKVTIPGKDFAEALFATWLGSDPGVRSVRRGLLEGR
jgi:hypothetical protein